MRYAYPCTLDPEEGGGFYVRFPDVPGALTSGATRAEALELAQDALGIMLGTYIDDRAEIPAPSRLAAGQALVPVPPVIAAKLMLYKAMREQRITKVALGKRLGVSESAVRKLCDPSRRSHVGQVEKALRAVGRSLVVEDHARSAGIAWAAEESPEWPRPRSTTD